MTTATTNNPFNARTSLDTPLGKRLVYRLDALKGHGDVQNLPYCIKVLLESCLRNLDHYVITEDHVRSVAKYNAKNVGETEIPFMCGRVVLQDFTGVPAVVDLAAMRDAMVRLTGRKDAAKKVNPLVPCDLVIDHSVQVDAFNSGIALTVNSQKEFERNQERYEFLKWGQSAFDNFRVVPPATGIVHQVNLEYLAKVVWENAAGGGDPTLYPDSLVGTDSHTTMINGLGVVGWGVGGIEAEAVMLGQPIYMLLPEVVGFKLTGKLREGTTATDLVLRVTEMLRKHGVVNKFVEFHGPGLANMPVANRATIANMAPEYGATIGYFPIDDQTLKYMRLTGRDEKLVQTVEQYAKLQGLWRDDGRRIAYSSDVELDLGEVEPSLAGPRRPQDRIALTDMRRQWWRDLQHTFEVDTTTLVHNPVGGWIEDGGQPIGQVGNQPNPRADHLGVGARHAAAAAPSNAGHAAILAEPVPAQSIKSDPGVRVELDGDAFTLRHGSVVIAAITSCTNTSNPDVMVAAGLVARKAAQRGLARKPWVKTSLAPGSKVVTEYLAKAQLIDDLEALGFYLVGYGCTTCIGNSGPLPEPISKAINDNNLVAASVLSGNRNFEGRIHPDCRANYLASPPLVVAYALVGTVDIDLVHDPLGKDRDGREVYLRDIWPSQKEIDDTIARCVTREQFVQQYAHVFDGSDEWRAISTSGGELFEWSEKSTYVQNPPFFIDMPAQPSAIESIRGARCLVKVGDSVTTDHISPAGSIKKDSPAGKFLLEHNVPVSQFNSYGSRRGNDRVMVRGTFANIRVKNHLADGKEGGWTRFLGRTRTGESGSQPRAPGSPSPAVGVGEITTIFDAACAYGACQTSEPAIRRDPAGTPLIVLAGKDYGMGSSRDWAAKGAYLLGVKAAIAESFERIHRSNLVGMGVLPLTYMEGQTAATLGLDGTEIYDIDVPAKLAPRQTINVAATTRDGKVIRFTTTCRVDTPVEVDYYRHGGILQFVLRKIAAS
jgi:aconitate hydratase